jgi:hypothetical protein
LENINPPGGGMWRQKLKGNPKNEQNIKEMESKKVK